MWLFDTFELSEHSMLVPGGPLSFVSSQENVIFRDIYHMQNILYTLPLVPNRIPALCLASFFFVLNM